MADVFISYARHDEVAARRVAKALQAAGFAVWWDADLPAHRAYSEVIERNLAEAKAVVVLWSATAAKSEWVRAEADFARNAGKLVQAEIDGTLPPMPFNQTQCASLKGWRGAAAHPGWTKLRASVQALVSGEAVGAVPAAPARAWRQRLWGRWGIAAALALVAAAAILLFVFGQHGDERKPVLAVLPFRTLDAHDESLVAGMWEDTRQAVGRNPQLVVLGPNTSQKLADKGEDAAKRAADYLLNASVRTAGDRIRISANLVRTDDGQQVWTQDFDRKLDDLFALQSEIANEIEGRIRGRLAERGGQTPENIATSGEVYALYSSARAKIRKRDHGLISSAREQLEQVVKKDPNFAPGWAALSQIALLQSPLEYSSLGNAPERYARKAIDLAPNLASGHAALAFALNLSGPVARAEIERAVQLDPNDYEAVLWLGNMRGGDGDKKGALEAFSRAVEIEPLFWPAVLNKLVLLREMHDNAGIQQLLEQERQVGADYFAAAIEIEQLISSGDLAKAVNLGLSVWKSGSPEARTLIGLSLWPVMLQLGFDDQVSKISPAPDFAPFLWRNDPKGLAMLEAHHLPPRKFFGVSPLVENAGRVFILSGKGAKFADMYRSMGLSGEQFAELMGDRDAFLVSAPLVAIALRGNGHADEADRLLEVAETRGKAALADGDPANSARLARIYAAQGRKPEALAQLTSAVSRGWLPAPPVLLTDLNSDPALQGLKSDPRFEMLRQRILGTIKRERAMVRIDMMN